MWPQRLSPKQEHGRAWEQVALAHLQAHGLTLIEANFTCKGGEIDLVMRDGATWVFVEVRHRADMAHGGAAASITPAKARRVLRSAQVYLQRMARMPACRIDVVAIDGHHIDWLRDAISA